ncbi:2-amino-4-hydroxy-6-hydroxymethyldihydropteridine diphosphokinase [Bacteroidia bacterium]|nr:2-amino-4-hydroxy-6-hydroxymethyldihydropteridine diphosphokinase [Bacteroidia bacterium]
MIKDTHTVYLALGTNLGDKNVNLLIAIAKIAEKIGIFSAVSSVYETEAWGYSSENTFLNMVVKVETTLQPLELLEVTQAIEKKIGRTEKTKTTYQDRIIDIDILLYDDLKYQSEKLTIPHPHYRERPFVWEPLQEIFCIL